MLRSARSHVFVDLPALVDRLLRQREKPFGLVRIGVGEAAVAQLAVAIVGKREAGAVGIQQEWRRACGAQHRVVSNQRPVSAGHRTVLLVEAITQLEAMCDAVAVGDHDRRPVVGFGLPEGEQRLLRIGAHGDSRDVDVAVRNDL